MGDPKVNNWFDFLLEIANLVAFSGTLSPLGDPYRSTVLEELDFTNKNCHGGKYLAKPTLL